MIECINDEEDFPYWEVSSSFFDLNYNVSMDDEGNLFDSCPDFYFRKSRMNLHISNPDSYCKHIKQVLEDRGWLYGETKNRQSKVRIYWN